MCMYSIHMHCVSICSACACTVHAYAQHARAQCKHMLSICMSTPQHFDHTLTLFRIKKPYNFWKMLNFNQKLVWTLLMGLNWSKNNDVFGLSYLKECVWVCWAYACTPFLPKNFEYLSSNQNLLVKKYLFWTTSQYIFEWWKKLVSKISCLGTFKRLLDELWI